MIPSKRHLQSHWPGVYQATTTVNPNYTRLKTAMKSMFRPHLSIIAGLILFSPLSQTPLHAQLYVEPASDGIDGADILCFEKTADGDLLAGTDRGMWRLPRAGVEWERVEFSTAVYVIKRLATGTLLCGASNGIFRSDDNGQTWTKRFNVPGTGVFAENEEGTIIAFDREGSVSTRSFYYRSTDDGTTWASFRVDYGTLFNTGVVWLGNRLFSGSTEGVRVSTTGAEEWELTSMTEPVSRIIKTGDGTLVVVAGTINVESRIYESRDSGATWQLADSIPGTFDAPYRRITHFGPGLKNDYYIGTISRDPDDGWNGIRRRNVGEEGWETVYISRGISGMNFALDGLWVGANFRAWRNEGPRWQDHSRGLKDLDVDRILHDSRGRLFTKIRDEKITIEGTTTYALYRSDDNGAHWERIVGDLAGVRIHVDGFDNVYAHRDTLVTVSDGQGNTFEQRRTHSIVSTDGGESWRTLHPAYAVTEVTTSEEILTGGEGVIVAELEDYDSFAPRPVPDLAISRDRGRTWVRMSDEGRPWQDPRNSPYPLTATIAANGDIIYSTVSSNNGAPDKGKGIYRIDADYNVEKLSGAFVAGDLRTSANGGEIIGTSYPDEAVRQGIYRSSSNGNNWEQYDPGLGEADKITPIEDGYWQILHYSGPKLSALVSKDYGNVWDFAEFWYRSVVMQGTDTLYGIRDGGIFRSDGNVLSWDTVTVRELPEAPKFLAVNGSEFLFIGTANRGIFRSVAPVGSTETEGERAFGEEELLVTLSNDRQYLRLIRHLSSPGVTRLRIVDLLGREVRVEEGREEPGQRQRQVFVGDLPRGTYLAVLERPSGRISTVFSLP